MLSSTDNILGSPNKVWPQLLAAMSCCFASLTTGTTLGWISPSLVKLLAPDSPIPTTPGEGATIASIMAVGGIMGPILFAYKVDLFGRKWMAFFGCFFCVISWIINIFSTQVWHLYIGRIFVGLGVGYTFGLSPVYIGEIAETQVRGWLSIVTTILFSAGSLFCYGFGPYVSFQMLNFLCLIFPLLGCLFLLWMPESPYFLVRYGRNHEAEKVLMWLRGQTNFETVKQEMVMIEEFVQMSPKRPLIKTFQELKHRSNYMALLILTILMTAQQFSGLTALKIYFHLIIISTKTNLNPEMTVLFIEVVGLLVTISSIWFIEKLGRKVLFLISCVGVVISCVVMSIYFALLSENIIGSETSWLALLAILLMQIFSCIGLSPIPAIIGSEMSSASIRSWYGAYKAIYMSVLNSLNAKIFQLLKDGYGIQYAFLMSTIVVTVCAIVTLIIFPETRGKTLLEIQNILSKKNIHERIKINNVTDTKL